MYQFVHAHTVNIRRYSAFRGKLFFIGNGIRMLIYFGLNAYAGMNFVWVYFKRDSKIFSLRQEFC